MDERNFRSLYYTKVGCFIKTEEKKPIDVLLKDRPLDKGKISQFALRFNIPDPVRSAVYFILLDVYPTGPDSKLISDQREQHFMDLKSSSKLLVNCHLPKTKLYSLLRYLEIGQLKLNFQLQLESHDSHMFMKICETLSQLVQTEHEVYWIAKGFFNVMKSYKPYLPILATYTRTLILKEDQELHNYLVEQNIMEQIPFQSWYEQGCIDLIPCSVLPRLWDKLIGGTSMIMIFFTVTMLLRLKQSILISKTSRDILDIIEQLHDSVFDIIITEAIEKWYHQYNSPIHPGSPSDCFKEPPAKPQTFRPKFPFKNNAKIMNKSMNNNYSHHHLRRSNC